MNHEPIRSWKKYDPTPKEEVTPWFDRAVTFFCYSVIISCGFTIIVIWFK